MRVWQLCHSPTTYTEIRKAWLACRRRVRLEYLHFLLPFAAVSALQFSQTLASSIRFPLRQFSLPNGLRVVLLEEPKAHSLSLVINYCSGARDEEPGKNGLAHLVEHMMFEGSARVGQGEHYRVIVDNGGTLNATTRPDETLYYEVLTPEQLDLALFLEADRMRSLTPNTERLEIQKRTVLSEGRLNMENTAYGRTEEAAWASAYSRFPYQHSPVGTIANIQSITVDDVKRFWQQYYTPRNAVLVVSGPFSPTDVQARIRSNFGQIDRSPELTVPDLLEPLQTKAKHIVLFDRFARSPRVDLVFKVAAGYSDEYYNLQAAADVLGRGETSLLNKYIAKRDAVARSVAAFVEPRQGPSLFTIRLVGNENTDPERLAQIAWQEINVLRTGAFSREVLERVRRYIERDVARQAQIQVTKAFQVAHFACVAGNPREMLMLQGRMKRVNTRSLQRAVQKYLTLSNSNTVVTLPEASQSHTTGRAVLPPEF